MIDRLLIEEIISANEISSLIGGYVKLKRSGSSLTGLCPFHNEKTPSFHVREDRQTFHCFGCGASGNVVTFVMMHENYEFLDAVKFLAERANINIEHSANTEKSGYIKEKKAVLLEINKTAARFFYDALNSDAGTAGMDYIKRRNISERVLKKCGLGYCPKNAPSLYSFLKEKGYDDDILLESGLISRTEKGLYDKFYGRVIFPIFDITGKIIGFGGRVIGDGMPKYLNSPETLLFEKKRVLYGLNFARKSKKREIIVVEGYMDAIALYQVGIMNAVATLGTAFTQYHARLLKNCADSVVLLFDSDEAGVKAVLKSLPYLKNEGLNIKVAQTKDAKDPDDYIKQFGAESFLSLLHNAKTHIAFQIDNERNKYDIDNNIEERVLFTKSVSKILGSVESSIERDAYITETANITGISPEAITADTLENAASYERHTLVVPEYKSVRGVQSGSAPKNILSAQREFLCLVARNKTAFIKSFEHMENEPFTTDTYNKLYKLIHSMHKNNDVITASKLAASFENIDEHKEIVDIFDADMPDTTEIVEKNLNGQIRAIKLHNIECKLDSLKLSGDGNAVNAVLSEQKSVAALYISLSDG